MGLDQAYEALSSVRDVEVARDVSLADRTTYHVGGPARLYVRVDSRPALVEVLDVLERYEAPWLVLGGGSNLLVADDGFEGCVVTLGRPFSFVDVRDNAIVAGGATRLASVVAVARHAGLSGIEYCAGIPGTLGGAVRMDAGSRTEWIGQRITSVEVATARGMRTLRGDEVVWSYRHSSVAEDAVIVSARLSLERSSAEAVSEEVSRRLSRRRATQPLGQPSCGSFFQNSEGLSVGRLIEKCGCKGYAVGDARVSDVHANFIVNGGHAHAADVLAVAQHVHDVVYAIRGVDLVPEVRLVGFPPVGIARGSR